MNVTRSQLWQLVQFGINHDAIGASRHIENLILQNENKKIHFSIKELEDTGGCARKIVFIKMLRNEIKGMTLKEAKDIADAGVLPAPYITENVLEFMRSYSWIVIN